MNFFRGKLFNVAVVNQLRWFEESGQWLKNVDQFHLGLASGKQVLQKHYTELEFINLQSFSMLLT